MGWFSCCDDDSVKTNDEQNLNPYKIDEQNLNPYEICALAIDQYPSILRRMSNVELYYLCENFIARDKYNVKKRTPQETASKLISFAKGECVDINDTKELQQTDFQPLENEAKQEYCAIQKHKDNWELTEKKKYYKNRKLDVPIQKLWQEKEKYMKQYKSSTKTKSLGEGGYSAIFAFIKSNILSTMHKDKSLAISVSVHDKHELNHIAYDYKVICSKILLSLFARQTKYYTDFMMKEIKGDKSINQDRIEYKMKMYYSDIINVAFKNISYVEKHKEIARELLFSAFGHNKINEYAKNGYLIEQKIYYGQPLSKNRILDKDGHIVDIDLSELNAIDKKNFDKLYKFVENSELFNLNEIFTNLKKDLTISPKLITYHALMELSKYDFEDFDDQKYTECIKDVLNTYMQLLSATGENFKGIDEDIVNICNEQLAVYNKYIDTINDYNLNDFKNDFKNEKSNITQKINNYRSMSGIIHGRRKKKYIPLKQCNNTNAKVYNMQPQNEKK